MKDDKPIDKSDFEELVALFRVLKKWRDELPLGKKMQLKRLSDSTGNEIHGGLVN